jgi:hypothetical protein
VQLVEAVPEVRAGLAQVDVLFGLAEAHIWRTARVTLMESAGEKPSWRSCARTRSQSSLAIVLSRSADVRLIYRLRGTSLRRRVSATRRTC